MPRSKALEYALAGMVLAVGAPSGWFVLRVWSAPGVSFATELAGSRSLYLYLLLGPLLTFALFGAWLGSVSDRLLHANHQLQELSLTDSLTSLGNARFFHQQLKVQCMRTARERRAPFAVIMIDLDHFKAVNDRFGHPVGDLVLRGVAQVLLQQARAGDVVCRVGGEEFAVLCPDTPRDSAALLAERLRVAVAAHAVVIPPGTRVSVTASFGVAEHRLDSAPSDVMLDADAALYEAKRGGRNQVQRAAPRESPAPASAS